MNKLMESQLYQLIAQNIQDVIWFQTPDGTLEYVSPSVCQLLGYHPDMMRQTKALDYVHPEDIPDVSRTFARIKIRQNSGRFVCRFRHKHGRYLWFESSCTAIFDKNGELERILGVGRDITERMQMEQRLIRAERIAHLGSWERDAFCHTLYWSEEMYHIFGVEPTEPMTIERFLSMVHPEDRHHVIQSIQTADMGGGYDVIYRIVRPNGDIRIVHAQGEIVYQNGVVSKVFGSLQDITEYKKAEHELRTSKENLKLAQKIARLGHWDWDARQNHLYWSDEVYRIFNLTEADRPADGLQGFLLLVHPDERDFVLQSIENALQGTPFDIEFRTILPNGAQPLVHVIGETDLDADGRATRLFGIVHDITTQRQTEELLRTSEKLSIAGQLAAGIAHEIRNPLTVLKGFLQMLNGPVVGQTEQYFDIMQSELVRIETIVNELLFLAKPQVTVFQTCDLQLIVREVVTLLGSQAVMKNVFLAVEYLSRHSIVTCEMNQLKQVFINIIKNAIEAMPNGGNLVIQLFSRDEMVCIDFVDEGPGIPPDILAKLGNPFFTTKEGGTGLGLMISQKIILAHHGTFKISSELNKGTTIHIALPLAK